MSKNTIQSVLKLTAGYELVFQSVDLVNSCLLWTVSGNIKPLC